VPVYSARGDISRLSSLVTTSLSECETGFGNMITAVYNVACLSKAGRSQELLERRMRNCITGEPLTSTMTSRLEHVDNTASIGSSRRHFL
jgi:hypothetical protein